jgi:hypothetical protein
VHVTIVHVVLDEKIRVFESWMLTSVGKGRSIPQNPTIFQIALQTLHHIGTGIDKMRKQSKNLSEATTTKLI